jgi:subtilisin family serine protease
MQTKSRRLLSAAAGMLLALSLTWPLVASGRPSLHSARVAHVPQLTATASNRVAAWFVELQEPPAAQVYAEAVESAPLVRRGTQGLQAEADAASQSQVSRLAAAQEALAPALSRLGAKELYRLQRALNGFAVMADARQARAMRQLPGVKAVRRIDPEYPFNRTSVPFIGAPSVWESTSPIPAGVTGQGVKIAIVDTGIDYIHGMFGGTGLLADYQQGATDSSDWTTNPTSGPGRFPTAKVVGGWDFVGDAYTGASVGVPDPNPMDCLGHGTHVASIAAGYGVTAAGATYPGPYNTTAPYATTPRIGPGVAPKASLYALRVFGCGGSTFYTADAIEWAMDPNGDGSLDDHLDVINMSLGSNFGGLNDTSTAASENAARIGMVVVAAAGNAGDTYFVSSSPASSGRTIAVANISDSGVGAYLQVNSPGGVAGNYGAGTASFGPTVLDSGGVTGDVVLVDDGTGTVTDGCEPITNDVSGKIALIDRGTCTFVVKTQNAQDAGAIGVIIANNAAGDAPGLGGSSGTITIPAISVSQADGTTIKGAGSTVNATFVAGGDGINSSSSRGPRTAVPIRLKPDVAAPGTNIPSAQTGVTCTSAGQGCITPNATGYIPDNAVLTISGTSMATPHVAGTMALLRQIHPDWTSEHLKALLMNYSLHDVFKFAGGLGAQIGAGRVGAGRIDAALSAPAQVLAMNADEPGVVSVSFDGEVAGTVTRTHNVTFFNVGATAVSGTLGLVTNVDAPGVSFSLPTTNVTIPAKGSITIPVQMDADAQQMDFSADPSVDPFQGGIPRFQLTEEAAYLTFAPAPPPPDAGPKNGFVPTLRLPVYAAVRPASAMASTGPLQATSGTTGSGYIDLAGTDLCTGTCSFDFPTERISLVSSFELQGVSPKNPDLLGSDFEAGDLRYAGVQYDANDNLLVFGVSTWKSWATPAQVAFTIVVDNNADGTDDMILVNPRFSIAAGTASDLFLSAVGPYPPSSVTSNNYVNLLDPGTIDTGLFQSNVMMMAASPAELGITPGSPFKWRVVSCPGFDFGCSDPAGEPLDTMGPFTWNTGAQGLNLDNRWLDLDYDGGSLPVEWDTDNLTANGSLGALLLHHWNGEGTRDEAVLVQTDAMTPPSSADVGVTLDLSASSVFVGTTGITATLTVANAGPEDATGVTVLASVSPSDGLQYVSDDSGGSFDPDTGIWTVGSLTAGGAAAHLTVTVNALRSGLYSFAAAVADSSPIDVALANNQASASLLVRPEGGRGDFNADGWSDIVWRNTSTGQLYAWFMSGTRQVSGSFFTPATVANVWQVQGIGDLDGDGDNDLLWHNTSTGQLYAWFMDGLAQVNGNFLTPSSVATVWQIQGLADLNADNKLDILWRNTSTGQLYAWFMDGITQSSGSFLTPKTVASVWQVRGLADFNGDGRPDILWYNTSTGQLYVWFMNGVTQSSGAFLSPMAVADKTWQVNMVADFNADGQPDILWRKTTTGQLYVWFMNGVTQSSGAFLNPSAVANTWQINPK